LKYHMSMTTAPPIPNNDEVGGQVGKATMKRKQG